MKYLIIIISLLTSFSLMAQRKKTSWKKMRNQDECREWEKNNGRKKSKQKYKEILVQIDLANKPIIEKYEEEYKELINRLSDLNEKYLKVLNHKDYKIVTMHTVMNMTNMNDIRSKIVSLLESKYLNFNNDDKPFENAAPYANIKMEKWLLLAKQYQKEVYSIEEKILGLKLSTLEKKLTNVKIILTSDDRIKIAPPPESCMGYEKKYISYYRTTFLYENFIDQAILYLSKAEAIERHKYFRRSSSVKYDIENIESRKKGYASLQKNNDKNARREIMTNFLTQTQKIENKDRNVEKEKIDKRYLVKRDLNDKNFLKSCESKTKNMFNNSPVDLGKKLDSIAVKSCRNIKSRTKELI